MLEQHYNSEAQSIFVSKGKREKGKKVFLSVGEKFLLKERILVAWAGKVPKKTFQGRGGGGGVPENDA